MKTFTAWILMVALTGCTTLRPVVADQPGFSQRIASGELLKIRDRVIIETQAGQTYEFAITSMNAASIDGKRQSIPLDQIVSIQKRIPSTKRTLLLVLAIAGGVVFTVALVSAFKVAVAAALFGNSH